MPIPRTTTPTPVTAVPGAPGAPLDGGPAHGRAPQPVTLRPVPGRSRQPVPLAHRAAQVPLLRVHAPLPVDAPLPRRGRPDVEAPVQDEPTTDPATVSAALVRGAVEAMRGDRQLAQLARWVTPGILEALATRARLVRAVPPSRAARAQGNPLPVRVRRVRLVRLGALVAEATVVVEDVDRVRAGAVRLEAHRGQWRAVALEIG